MPFTETAAGREMKRNSESDAHHSLIIVNPS